MNVKNVDLSQFKAFSDDSFNVIQMTEFISDKMENILWEKEKNWFKTCIFCVSHNV